MAVFISQGHSGASAKLVLEVFTKLAIEGDLAPLLT
jgi:hypothetical protein